MSDEVQQVKDKIDLVDFISEYLPLKRAGRNFRTVCPFHAEKNPSFFVSPERQVWRCFGCGKGGDLFTFLMEKEGLDFGEALRILAQKAGVKLSRGFSEKKTEKKERLLALVNLALEFYHYLLTKHQIGEKARKYLESRKVDTQQIEQFKLGYAPDSWEATGKFLLNRKFIQQEIQESGLIIPQTNQRQPTSAHRAWYDRFRGRIVFPVFDLLGRVVGFSARSLVDKQDVPKYINSPDSVIFHKGKLLYGLNLAKDEIRQKDFVVLVEGNVDVISCYKSGVKNVVAQLGTGLTEDQTKLIKRFTKNVIFALDSDAAGEQATLRGIEVASFSGLDCKIATLTHAKDPDEAINKNVAQFKKDLKEAQPFFDYLLSLGKKKHDISSASGKRWVADLVLPYVALLTDEIVKDSLVKKFAEELGVQERSVWQELETRKTQRITREIEGKGKAERLRRVAKPREELMAEHFLGSLISTPPILLAKEKFKKIIEVVKDDYFPTENLLSIWREVKNQLTECKKIEIRDLGKDLSKSAQSQLDFLVLKIPEEIEEEEKFLKELFVILNGLENLFLKKEINRLTGKLRQAERGEDSDKITELRTKLSELTKSLK